MAISELNQAEKSTYQSTPTLYRIKHKDGSYIYAETIGIDMLKNIYVNGIVVFCRNVTERIKYEKKLSESEAKLKESQRVAKIGHYDFYIQTGNWFSSESLDEIFGIDESFPHDVESWKAMIHPADRENIGRYLEEHVIKGKNRFEKEYRIIRYTDKEVIWVYGLGNLEFNEMGIPIKMFGTIQNINERKKAQNILFNSEQRFKYIWENTLDAMRLTDERGKIVLVNNAFCSLVNKKREELEGYNFTVVFPDDQKEAARARYIENFSNKTIAGKSEYNLTFWNKKVIYANIARAYIKIPEQPALLLTVLHDITDRKIAEDYLKESEEKFRHAFDYSATGVVILNLDGKFQKVNSSFANMMGYSENELRKLSFKDITYTEDVETSNFNTK